MGVRLRAGGFATGSSIGGQGSEPDSSGSAQSAGGRGVLPRRVLVFPDPRAGPKRVHGFPGHRERHVAERKKPGRVAESPEVGRVLGVSPSRQQGDAGNPPGPRAVRVLSRRMGSTRTVRTGGWGDGTPPPTTPARSRARADLRPEPEHLH